MEEATDDGFGVTAEAVRDDLTLGSIFLHGEREGNRCGGGEVTGDGFQCVMEAVMDMEFDFLEAKRGIIGCGAHVFTRSEEEVEGDGDQAGDDFLIFGGIGCVGLVEDENDAQDRDGFYMGWRCIFFLVTPELAGKANIDFTEGILADVRGPQLGERLTHHADGVLNCFRADGFMLGGGLTITVALGKYLDDGAEVVTVLYKWINVKLEVEYFPERPMRIHCFGAFSIDTQSGLFLYKAEVKAESVSFWSGNIHQGIF
jgi:hypothetical protein